MPSKLRGPTPETCQPGEVAWTSPMQEGAASESSPCNAHVVQALGPAPFGQGLLAHLQQDRAPASVLLLAHDKHAPLVDVAGASLTGNSFYDLDLFAGTGVLDNIPDEDDALVAGAGALQASVVGLYGVVIVVMIVVMTVVMVMIVYPICVHS